MSDFDENTQQVFRKLAQVQEEFNAQLLRNLGSGRLPAFAELFRHVAAGLASDPERVRALQGHYYQEQLALWLRCFGPEPIDGPDADAPDRRFSSPEWRSLPWFDYLRQSYGLSSRWLADLVETAQVDATTHCRLRFYARQLIDAMAPSNYAATNPEAIKLALQTQGESITRGLKNLIDDSDKGRISMTDESAFEVGCNLAITSGAVVYQNELMQVLQYRPLTETVRQLPLVIVPPCINKYYILDLQPENSFVRYALSKGQTVFIVSWRNIPTPLGQTGWDDYLEHGVIRAIEVARAICAVPKVNTLGFCVGGTLLACALAVLRRKHRRPAASLTLLASMLDFSDSGDISAYVDADYVNQVEQDFRNGGIFPGSQLARAFASLRANDLIWKYVIDNYLKGHTPNAFDLLYWNSDSANLPGPMYAYYLRHMYLENSLRRADALTMCGVPVDLARIDLPTYVLATAQDHIVPWVAAYSSACLLGQNVAFVRGASGHIAGVINPASEDRRSFRTGPMTPSAQSWIESSVEHPGSWWKHWASWIKARSGSEVPARTVLGSRKHFEIEPAPGSYVRERF